MLLLVQVEVRVCLRQLDTSMHLLKEGVRLHKLQQLGSNSLDKRSDQTVMIYCHELLRCGQLVLKDSHQDSGDCAVWHTTVAGVRAQAAHQSFTPCTDLIDDLAAGWVFLSPQQIPEAVHRHGVLLKPACYAIY
jgi:hypothetical protein